MSKVHRGLRLSGSLLLFGLIACTLPGGKQNESTLTGTVAAQRLDMGTRSVAPGPQLVGLGVEEFNRLIVAARADDAASVAADPPVRGLNAASALAPSAQLDFGDFSFSEHNASLASEGEFAAGSWTRIPEDIGGGPPSGNYQSCGDPDQLRVLLDADFDLAIPAGIAASTL